MTFKRSPDSIAATVSQRLLLAFILSATAGAFPAVAATFTWDGGGADDNWNTPANWSGDTAATSATDTALRFGGQTRLTPTATAPFSLNSITFLSGAGAFTLGGSSLTLTNGGSVTNSSSSLQTIANSGITLSGASTWNTGSGGLSVSSVLSGGSGSLTKSGAGILTLSGANSYTGVTHISAGTLSVTHASALGASSGGVTMSFGATLNLDNVNIGAENITLRGAGVGGQGALTATGTSTFAGQLIFDDDATIGVTGTLTLDAMKELYSKLTATKVGAGTLILGGTGHVDRTEFAINEGSVILNKTGTYALSGDHLTVNNGARLQLAGTGDNQINNVTRLIVNSGGLFDTNGRNEVVASLEGGGTVTNTAASTTSQLIVGGPDYNPSSTFSGVLEDGAGKIALEKRGTGTLTLSGANTYSGDTTVSDGTVLVTGSLGAGNYAGLITNSGTLSFNSATHQTLAGVISGTGALTQSGAGTLTVSAQNTYTGATTINAGSLVVDGSIGSSAVTINNTGTLSGSGTVGTVTIASGGLISPGNSPGVLNTGSQTWNGGGGYVWEINNATGSAGTNYDLLSISGALLIAATSENVFTLNVTSLLADHTPGNALNFDAAQNYSFTLASTTDGIFGFDASAFAIDTSGFTNALDGGTWTLALANFDRDLTLNFATASAIPEPSTYAAFAGLGALGLALLRRRSRRA